MGHVTIVATGGTIASRKDPETGAVVPAVGAEDLVTSVPALADIAQLEVVELAAVSSWDVTQHMMAELARLITAHAGGTDGVVVTHGTDTMEETAFALAALLDLDVPVVLTGAMRPADAPDPDGPTNLLDAVRAAVSSELREAGVVVVMNGEIHGARDVTKAHTTATDAFTSPRVGPVGHVEGDLVTLGRTPTVVPPIAIGDPEMRVELVKMVTGLGEDAFRRLADEDIQGVVVEGSGSGNLPGTSVPGLRALLDRGVPVVLASRCMAGPVDPVYGGPGGGATLVELGVIPGSDLSGPKARIALMFLLGGGADLEAMRDWFRRAG